MRKLDKIRAAHGTRGKAGNMQVAKTILEQMGGNQFIAMTGAHHLAGSKNTLHFSFKGSRKTNKCKITLNGVDLYDVEFFKLNLRAADPCPLINSYNNIYCDQLQGIFEKATWLYTSL